MTSALSSSSRGPVVAGLPARERQRRRRRLLSATVIGRPGVTVGEVDAPRARVGRPRPEPEHTPPPTVGAFWYVIERSFQFESAVARTSKPVTRRRSAQDQRRADDRSRHRRQVEPDVRGASRRLHPRAALSWSRSAASAPRHRRRRRRPPRSWSSARRRTQPERATRVRRATSGPPSPRQRWAGSRADARRDPNPESTAAMRRLRDLALGLRAACNRAHAVSRRRDRDPNSASSRRRSPRIRRRPA